MAGESVCSAKTELHPHHAWAFHRPISHQTLRNRDVNAARNIAFVFWWLRTHGGKRPPGFRRSVVDGGGAKTSGSRLQQIIPTESLPGLSSIQGRESRFETGLFFSTVDSG